MDGWIHSFCSNSRRVDNVTTMIRQCSSSTFSGLWPKLKTLNLDKLYDGGEVPISGLTGTSFSRKSYSASEWTLGIQTHAWISLNAILTASWPPLLDSIIHLLLDVKP